MMFDPHEIYDEVTLAQLFAERTQLLINEVTYGFLAQEDKRKPYRHLNAHTAFIKAEMATESLASLAESLDRMAMDMHSTEKEKEAVTPKDHNDTTRAERIDEIMNQICTFAGMIENFPDWLERMKQLRFVAMCLAMGCNDYNFTCKEPGQE